MRILFTILFFAASSAFAEEPRMMSLREDKTFTKRTVPDNWGTASNGLCCSIRIGKPKRIEQGFPLELFFKNVGDKPILLTHPYDLRAEPWIWSLSIVGPRGPVAYYGDTVVYTLSMRELKPGQVAKYSGNARSPVWDIAEEGQYKLKVKYESGGAGPGDTRPIWGGKVESNEVETILK